MARALTGYGEYHSVAEHTSRAAPRTHPEKMALAAGVLIANEKRGFEMTDTDSDQFAAKRRIGSKALESTSA